MGITYAAAINGLPNVSVLSTSFYIPQLHTTRRIWVYLPSSYAQTTQRYPVLYMHDGQNVFDVLTSFSGEWAVDETLKNKEQQGDPGCIVVAVDHGGSERINEYSPYVNPEYGGGKGDLYLDFLVHTLKPYIDSVCRTQPGRTSTAIAGSSMGGLISLYAGVKYNEVYGMVGVFSPSFWFSDSLYTFVEQHHKQFDTRWYIVAGEKENSSMAASVQRMAALLGTKGYKEVRTKMVIGGTHSELFWQQEFGACYDWLFRRR